MSENKYFDAIEAVIGTEKGRENASKEELLLIALIKELQILNETLKETFTDGYGDQISLEVVLARIFGRP